MHITTEYLRRYTPRNHDHACARSTGIAVEVRRVSAVAGLLLAGAGALAHPIVLAERGIPKATIVVGANPSVQAREAAVELQQILCRVSGATLPIVPTATGTRLLVGISAAGSEARHRDIAIPSGVGNACDEEGYVIVAGGQDVILAGNETPPYQGTYYAVYDLLHRLGCRWYVPGEFGEYLPSLSSVTIEAIRKVVRPEFRVRDMSSAGPGGPDAPRRRAEYLLWKRRNRMSGPDLVSQGFLPAPGDGSIQNLLPAAQYFSAHPEYYAVKQDGTRRSDMPCMSSAGAVDAAAGTIAAHFAAHPDYRCYSFSAPDEPILCHCPDCKKAMLSGFRSEGWGDVSDAYYRFVTRLADKVAGRCPGKYVQTMAYFNRVRPPVAPSERRSNLLIYMAFIHQCPVHSFTDARCWSRNAAAGISGRWAELTAGQVYYDYDVHDWTMSQRPGWRSEAMAEDLRLLKHNGGWGFCGQGECAWLQNGLSPYIRARLAWDLNETPAQMIRDFCGRFFGPAAAPMGRYYLSMEALIRRTVVDRPAMTEFGEIDWSTGKTQHRVNDFVAILPRVTLERLRVDLDRAAGVASQEPFRSRVAAFRAQLDRLLAMHGAYEAMARGDYRAAAAHGREMARICERVGRPEILTDHSGVLEGTRTGITLEGSSFGATIAAFADSVGRLVHGPEGRLIAVLPAVAAFREDPLPTGIVKAWYKPGISEVGWRPLRMTSTWHSQGVNTAEGRRFSGVGWYRARVTIPAGTDLRAARIAVPGLDAHAATIWCNGNYVGRVERDPRGDISLAIGQQLKTGENLIVLRASTADGGGITIPPFLYRPVQAAEPGDG